MCVFITLPKTEKKKLNNYTSISCIWAAEEHQKRFCLHKKRSNFIVFLNYLFMKF